MKPRCNHHDVIIIGGGFAGLAIAYQLARRRARVLLLEAASLGGQRLAAPGSFGRRLADAAIGRTLAVYRRF